MRLLLFACLVALLFPLLHCVESNELLGCNQHCIQLVLNKKIPLSEFSNCTRSCLLNVENTVDDTTFMLKHLESLTKQILQNVQPQPLLKMNASDPQIPQQQQQQEKTNASPTFRVTTDVLNVRSGPCTDKSVIATLKAGDKVASTGAAQSNSCGHNWYGISGGFGSGWSAAEFLSCTLETTDAVNVRSGPCTDQRVIITLNQGARVSFNGLIRTACGYTWYGIAGGFGSGWSASNYLKEVSGGGCRTRQYPLFKQCDSRWANNRLGRDSTICAVGCLMSSVSMAINGLGRTIDGQTSNPATLNNFLLNHGGYYGNDFVWGTVSRFGLSYIGQTRSIGDIKNHVCRDAVVILNVNRGGHWVLATGVDGDTFYVNDSGFSRLTYSASEVVLAGVYNVV